MKKIRDNPYTYLNRYNHKLGSRQKAIFRDIWEEFWQKEKNYRRYLDVEQVTSELVKKAREAVEAEDLKKLAAKTGRGAGGSSGVKATARPPVYELLEKTLKEGTGLQAKPDDQ